MTLTYQVLVLGWPRNLAQLVRQLGKHGFAISILAPDSADAATEKKVAKMKGVRRTLGSPFVREDLVRATPRPQPSFQNHLALSPRSPGLN